MFNVIDSGNAQEKDRRAFRRLCSLRLARQSGYFDESGTEPMPEIVADGTRPENHQNPYRSIDWEKESARANSQLFSIAQAESAAPRRYCPQCGSWNYKYPAPCPVCWEKYYQTDLKRIQENRQRRAFCTFCGSECQSGSYICHSCYERS